MASKSLIYEFFGVDAGAGAQFDRMAAKADTGGVAWKKYMLGAGVAVAAVAAYSLKAATDFQKSTELIHTQAGVTQSDLDGMRKGILAMAGAVGTSPEALSEALFHIASTGQRGAEALNELKIAAEGAKVGGADLTDVTNALNATIVSGIKGAGNFSHAMGALNAIVGAGDMHMQDLADALGSGVLAVVKTFGVNLTQAGAALAVFGDNNIRGAQAATYLRQAVQSISDPSVNAAKAFGQIHLTVDQLKNSLAKGGLTGALDTLHSHFEDSGIAANKWGDILEEAFTKKAGTGITLLLEQFGRYETKQAEIAQGSKTFGDDWAATTKNLSFQFDRLRADVEVLAVEFGDALLPVAMDALRALFGLAAAVEDVVGWFKKHQAATVALAAVIGSVLLPKLIAMATAFAVSTLTTFANGLAAVTLKLIGTTSALGEVNDEAGLMTGAFSPIGLGFAAIAAAGVEAFVQIRDRSKEATEAAQNFADSLHIDFTSLPSIADGIQNMNRGIATLKSAPNTLGVLNRTIGAFQGQLESLTATQRTVTSNTGHMAAEFNLTKTQVAALAKSAGIDLTGRLSDVEKGFQGAIQAAEQSHHPMQQAQSDFKDMGSAATTLTQSIDDLSAAWDNYVGNFLGLKQAQLDFTNDLVTLTGDLKKSHGSIADNGAAARQSRGDFLSLVGQIENVTTATYKNSAQQNAAVASAKRMRASIEALGLSGPLAERSLNKLSAFINSFANHAGGEGSRTGKDYGAGLIAGLNAMLGPVGSAARALAGEIDKNARQETGAKSPSKKAHKTGEDYGQGLANGVKSKSKTVELSAQYVAKMLTEGLLHGWTGAADSIKNALSTPIQDALTHLTDTLDKEMSKQETILKKAEANYKTLAQARKQAIGSLKQSIIGSTDISSVLGQTDMFGQPTTGNIGASLKASLGLVRTEARDLAKLRKMGLSQVLLNQISAQSPQDAVTLAQQILSGQAGSIASLNAMEKQIGTYAGRSATTVVNSPHEKEQIHAAKRQEHIQEQILHELQKQTRQEERQAARAIAGNVTVHMDGRTYKVSDAEAREIRKALKRIERQGVK